MPDMKRIYVVERLPVSRMPDGPKPEWMSVGSYDRAEDAGKHAADLKPTLGDLNAGIRIRQFWVQSWPSGQPPRHDGKVTPDTGAVTQLVTMTCVDHPEQQVKVFDPTVTVRCRTCNKAMTTNDMAEAVNAGELTDLTNG